MSYCYDSGPVRTFLSDDRAITELRKDMTSLRTRIRFQQQIGCTEGVERLRREYQRAVRRLRTKQDRVGGVG